MTREQELRKRTEELIALRGDLQLAQDLQGPHGHAVMRIKQQIAVQEESIRTLKAIEGIPGKERAA